MRILIMGGNSGIGAECARTLEDRGHNVMYPTPEIVDVRSESQIQHFMMNHDPFDAMVYSVGVNYLSWAEEIHFKTMLEVYDINVVGLVRMLSFMRPHRVVVIGSDAAEMPMRTSVAYNASKAALHMAVRCIARERPHMPINIVAPGKVVDTPMTEYVERRTTEIRHWKPSDLRSYELGKIPLGRYAAAEEVAEVVRWLLEDAPNYLIGEIIKVNGGR